MSEQTQQDRRPNQDRGHNQDTISVDRPALSVFKEALIKSGTFGVVAVGVGCVIVAFAARKFAPVDSL